jgi:hypothetical protein
MDDEFAMPTTAEDFLDLARGVLIAKAVPDRRDTMVAATYTSAAEILADDASTLPDLLCAHQRLRDALDDTTPGPWRTQLFAADTWVDIARATVQARRLARAAEKTDAAQVNDAGREVDIDDPTP